MKQGRNLFVAATAAEAKAAVAPPTAGAEHVWFSQAMLDVGAERRRQIEIEGFDDTHDQAHRGGELLRAALAYGTRSAVWLQMRAHGVPEDKIAAEAGRAGVPSTWPWSRDCWKPHPLRRCLVIVAALVIAQIERLDREEAQR